MATIDVTSISLLENILNVSDVNYTMQIKNLNGICADAGTENSSLCNKAALGISLSTPILMGSFGILGNIIALIVLFTTKKELQKTVFYMMLFALAWTDLIGQILVAPIAIIVYANNLEWVGGEPLCKYHAFMMICLGIITPLHVCCMSVERFLAMRFTYFHARVVNKFRARLAIVLCWVFVLVFCTLPLIGFGSYEHQFPGSWCFLNFHRESPSDIAYAYSYAFINVIIITIIIVCNTGVMLTLIKMRKSRKINSSPSIERRNGTNRQRSKFKVEEETQMVWFLCAITVVFATCWFPLNIHILINQVTGRVNYAADLLGVRMASINQILDPWLYILLRKRVFIKMCKFIKNFITKGRRYESPRRSTRQLFSRDGKTTMSHSNGGVSQYAHELKCYTPEVQVTINGNFLEVSLPDTPVVKGQLCDSNADQSDVGSDSTSSISDLIEDGDHQLSNHRCPPFNRSLSSGPKFCVKVNVDSNSDNSNMGDKVKQTGSNFSQLGIFTALRKRSLQNDEKSTQRTRSKSLPGELSCRV